MQYVAIDTETVLIADRDGVTKRDGKWTPGKGGNRTRDFICTSPFVVPDLVCVSYYGMGTSGYWMHHDAEGRTQLREWARDPDVTLVFHNAPFDLQVLRKAGWLLQDDVLRLLEYDRIHDTIVMDLLVRLANGEFDMPRWPEAEVPQPYPRSLKVLAKECCAIDVAKEGNVRLTFEQFLGKPELPPDWAHYATQDAVVTYRVFRALEQRMKLVDKDGERLSEPLQNRANWVLSEYEQRGVRVNRAEAQRLYDIFRSDVVPLQEELARAGYGEWLPTPKQRTTEYMGLGIAGGVGWRYDGRGGVVRYTTLKKKIKRETSPAKFKLCQNRIRSELECIAADHPHLEPPKTPKGAVSLDGEWWKDKLPPEYPGLQTWARYCRLQKVLGTYLQLYSAVDRVFPRWRLLLRSGRLAAASPNVLNIPKRKYGLRSLFVPEPGQKFLVADYSTQELLTLTEVMLNMGIKGPMFEAITSGADIHKVAAAFLNDIPVEDVTKQQRQGAKAVNFGVPGGLGARKLKEYAENTYGVHWTLEEARDMRKKYLQMFPDVAAFLKRCSVNLTESLALTLGRRSLKPVYEELGLDPETSRTWDLLQVMRKHEDKNVRFLATKAERQTLVRLPSGRVRKNARFTEGANTYFQGTASDVTKRAMWLAYTAGLDVVLVVHDELVVQTENPELDKTLLEDVMKRAFLDICPRIGGSAGVEIEERSAWGKATNAEGEAI